ncbi:MAG TPA: pitrilysin family protein [Hyphomicrobiaceae bacterium]|nr:pitrilysin family protein [Hyphomicrobiaceae bacterium]
MQITCERAIKRRLGVGLAMAAFAAFAVSPARAELKVSTFNLANGMQVVVIPDHRVPVVTHMVWYRCGAADDPWGTSGIAHFLEHLMFKSTGKIKSGEFSRIITRLGGRDNASTTHDTTSYFQRVAKEHLKTVMGLEADRMVNLRLNEEEVRTERNVILEERRSSVDGSPLSLLSEQMLASLYQNHPYHRPALGWEHEMSQLSLKDAAAFYRRFYAPNNAVLVVAGDVTPQEVRPLAEATYGRNRANLAIGQRSRPKEPPAIAARRLRLEDARAGAPLLLRYYRVPTYASGRPGEAEALELLGWIIGGDDTSRMYRRLVETNLASTAGTNYEAGTLDSGRMAAVIIPLPGTALEKAEAELDAIVKEIREKGVTQEELDRAKSSLEAQRVFELDNQSTLANRYGQAIALGRSIADIEALPGRMQAVTLDDIKRTAVAFLDARFSVTGTLVPPPQTGAPSQTPMATRQ